MEHGNYEVTLKHCHVQSLGWVHPLDCLGKKRQPILGTILQMCCSLENPGPGRRLCLSRDRGMQTLLWQSGGLCPSCAPQAKQPIVQDRLLSFLPFASTEAWLTHLLSPQGLPLLSWPLSKLSLPPWTSAIASYLISPLWACLDPLHFCPERQSEPLLQNIELMLLTAYLKSCHPSRCLKNKPQTIWQKQQMQTVIALVL